MAEPVTLEGIGKSRLRHTAHLDGPRGKAGWFGDLHQCVEHPRLSRMTKYIRADRSTKVTWRVDGADVADLSAAIAALNVPPVLTEAESAALEKYPTEWTHAHECMRLVGGYELHHVLDNKGMIENDGDRNWRRKP